MNRRKAALLGVVAFISYAYFYQAGGWNQNSRFDLVKSLVDRGSLNIDKYATNTGDRAKCGAHLCSDKAPGAALTAVPLFAAADAIGVDTDGDTGLYLCGVAAAALPAALAAMTLFFLALALGATPGGAGFAAATLGFATPMFAYATVFFGHALASACLLFAFFAAVSLRDPGRDFLRAVGLGLAAGWAVVTEFPCAPPAVIIAVLALANVARPRWLRVGAGVLAGAVVAGAVLMIYNYAAFGNPVHLGYESVQGFVGMKEGVMGITYPKPYVLYAILVSPYRGLLLFAPALALGPWGLAALMKQPESRRSMLVAVAIVVYFVLFNASYIYWDGGWSYGPRHVAPAIPFLALGLAPLWTRAKKALKAVLAALASLGAAAALVTVSVIATPPDTFKNPFGEVLVSAFWHGTLGVNRQTALMSSQAQEKDIPLPWRAAWNLGKLMGLHGLATLVPLILLWVGAGYLWWRWRERPAAPAKPAPAKAKVTPVAYKKRR